MFPKESSLLKHFFRMGPVTECPPSVFAHGFAPHANPCHPSILNKSIRHGTNEFTQLVLLLLFC